ncbi:ankyrin repeat domain-containing protein SOWAHD isoform X1 [Tachysurus ichikawai]
MFLNSKLLNEDTAIRDYSRHKGRQTALHWAAKHGKEDMATAMADAGADVNTKAHVSNYPEFRPSVCMGNCLVRYSDDILQRLPVFQASDITPLKGNAPNPAVQMNAVSASQRMFINQTVSC